MREYAPRYVFHGSSGDSRLLENRIRRRSLFSEKWGLLAGKVPVINQTSKASFGLVRQLPRAVRNLSGRSTVSP